MELCIKTDWLRGRSEKASRFNPCFNGTMYKNPHFYQPISIVCVGFNPCFNGTMYKNTPVQSNNFQHKIVSILVLMELCIKTACIHRVASRMLLVSILVLMELCIKTCVCGIFRWRCIVSILVLMELCIKTDGELKYTALYNAFQSLF